MLKYVLFAYFFIASVSGLKVIGPGMSRTGTRTLKFALEILFSRQDYDAKVYHSDVWFGKPDHIAAWKDYFAGKLQGKTVEFDLNSIYGMYEAGTDVPTALLWKELIEQYPKAKVILTVRDEEKWFQSWCNAINKVKDHAKINPKFHEILGEATVRMHAYYMNSTEMSTFDVFMPDNDACQYKDIFVDRYKRHNEEVIQVVPKENLLIINVADNHYDNWEELCTFLNVPIPSVPFPNTNKGDANQMVEESKLNFFRSVIEEEEAEYYGNNFVGWFLWRFMLVLIVCVLINSVAKAMKKSKSRYSRNETGKLEN